MATYSLAITGCLAGNPNQPLNHTMDDAVARPGAQQNAMQLGTPFLAKGPDGASRLYTYDAERSTPALPVLKRYGPP